MHTTSAHGSASSVVVLADDVVAEVVMLTVDAARVVVVSEGRTRAEIVDEGYTIVTSTVDEILWPLDVSDKKEPVGQYPILISALEVTPPTTHDPSGRSVDVLRRAQPHIPKQSLAHVIL